MKIAVLVKQVADTAARIELNPESSAVKLDGVQMVLNPYDEFAVEQAILVKEAKGGEVVVFNVGPDSADEAVKTALAMGGDKAMVLRDEAAADLDAGGIARALAKMIEKEGDVDLVFCGKQATDSDTHQVGPALAQLLGMPSVSFITSIEVGEGEVTVGREAEGVKETLGVTLPGLFSCQKGLNEPRYPSLPGIMQAARKPKEVLTLADIGVDAAAVVSRTSMEMPPPRAEGKIIEGEASDQASQLVDLLHNEAKAV